MSALGDEKAAEKKFKISGKFTGGVNSHGVWTDESRNAAGGVRFGNDWVEQERATLNKKPLSMTQRLEAAQKKERLGASAPEVTVKVPDKTSLKDKVKEQVKAKAKEAVKAKSLLSPRAEQEKKRLEGLFSTHTTINASDSGMAGMVKQILERSKK
jgi:hypothetical protein